MAIVTERGVIEHPLKLDLGPVLRLANLAEVRDIAGYTVLNVFEALGIQYERIYLAFEPHGASLMIE